MVLFHIHRRIEHLSVHGTGSYFFESLHLDLSELRELYPEMLDPVFLTRRSRNQRDVVF